MEFSFTSEQHQFREVVQRFMKDKSPSTEVRRLMETGDGFDPEVWKQLSGTAAADSRNVHQVRKVNQTRFTVSSLRRVLRGLESVQRR